MITKLLNAFMDYALSRPVNKGKSYEGEDSPGWAYTIKDEQGNPYLSRVLLPRMRLPFIGSFRPMLHKFHRPDKDKDLHNHPWSWAKSIVLTGGYFEERLTGRKLICDCGLPRCRDVYKHLTETKLVTRFNALTDKDYHRVKEVAKDTFTLFISGPRTQDWGFMVNGKHVPWKTYLGIK